MGSGTIKKKVGMNEVRVVGATDNLNDYIDAGIYYIGDASNILNYPYFGAEGGYGYCYMMVCKYDGTNATKQVIYADATFTRGRAGNPPTWGAWDGTNITVSNANVLTTSHSLQTARASKTGRMYVANITIDLTSNVSAWTTIFTLKNVRIAASQYAPGYIGGSNSQLFYIGASGDVSCISALTSGTQIKVLISLVLE